MMASKQILRLIAAIGIVSLSSYVKAESFSMQSFYFPGDGTTPTLMQYLDTQSYEAKSAAHYCIVAVQYGCSGCH